MKIISVRFCNINSLKDEHYIDFSAPPFFGSGLFSITGATGAGKTTILDAITLALYGRTPRQKLGEQITEIVTRFTTFAFSEVVFDAENKQYRARWSVRRARGKLDGAFQPSQMELADALTGEVLESKTTQTRARIVQLLNLDYDQFLRSVLLAQGDFTRFLKADDKEKSALLEKVTNTGIYSRISAFVYEKAERVEKKVLEELRQKLEGVALLGEDELLVKEAQLKDLANRESELMRERNQLMQERQWLERISALNGELNGWLEREREFALEAERSAADLGRLYQHKRALPFQTKLSEYRFKRGQLEQYRREADEIQSSIPRQQSVCEELTQKKAAVDNQLDGLHRDRIVLEKIIGQVLPLDARIQHVESEYDKVCQQLADLNSSIQKEEDHLSGISEKLTYARRILDEGETWLQTNAVDERIVTLLPEITTIGTQLQETEAIIVRASNAQKDEQRKIEAVQGEIVAIEKQLAMKESERQHNEQNIVHIEQELNQLLDGKTVADLRLSVTMLQEQSFLCDKQYELAMRIADQRKRAAALVTEITRQEEVLQQKTNIASDLQHRLSSEIRLSEAYDEIVQKEKLIAKYEDARQHLVKGDPCPLCGSTEHPYVQEYHSKEIDENTQKLQHQKLKVETLRTAVSAAETEIARMSASIESQEKILESIRNEIESDEQRFEHNNQKLPVQLDPENLSLLERLSQSKQQEFRSKQLLVEQVERKTEEVQKIHQQLQAIRVVIADLSVKRESCVAQGHALTERVAAAEREQQAGRERYSTLVEQITQLLQPFRILFGGNEHTYEAALEQLKTRSDMFASKQREVSAIQREIDLLAKDLRHSEVTCQSLREDRAKFDSSREQLNVSLTQLKQERFSLFGEKSPEVEQQQIGENITEMTAKASSLLQELEQQQASLLQMKHTLDGIFEKHAALSREIGGLQSSLLDACQKADFATIDKLSAAILSSDDAQRLEELERAIERTRTEIRQSITQLQKTLLEERAKNTSQRDLGELETLIAAIDVQLREVNQQMGSIRTVLDQHHAAVRRYQEIQEAVARQELVYRRWHQLSDMIGSADGDKFKRFAQGVTLARLVQLANIRLSAFSDRYQLVKQPGNSLELSIVDNWQAGTSRPVSTLSGGESFLVSLALALGLSDLASNKIQIDSLFIDEGFGTLDSETLEVAVDALENLRSDGKLIGIISHIDALKERITVRIHVEKLAGGVSRLQVMECGSPLAFS